MILTPEQWYDLIDTSMKLLAGAGIAVVVTWILTLNRRKHEMQVIDRNIGFVNDKKVWGEAYRNLAMAQIALHKEIGLAIDALYESRG